MLITLKLIARALRPHLMQCCTFNRLQNTDSWEWPSGWNLDCFYYFQDERRTLRTHARCYSLRLYKVKIYLSETPTSCHKIILSGHTAFQLVSIFQRNFID